MKVFGCNADCAWYVSHECGVVYAAEKLEGEKTKQSSPCPANPNASPQGICPLTGAPCRKDCAWFDSYQCT
jgi:hypothetical protein